jgi:hypothetical protein
MRQWIKGDGIVGRWDFSLPVFRSESDFNKLWIHFFYKWSVFKILSNNHSFFLSKPVNAQLLCGKDTIYRFGILNVLRAGLWIRIGPDPKLFPT